jgi:hypothetical protein
MESKIVIRRALEALMKALGPVETGRFLNLLHRRSLDSVEWHRLWQDDLDSQQFFGEVFGPAPEATEAHGK